jgi:hypothetical protein
LAAPRAGKRFTRCVFVHSGMKIENRLPVAVVVSTYDVGDFLYWIPNQVRPLEPCTTGVVQAHDGGRCKIKVEIVDGPRTWVLDRPDSRIYTDADIVQLGEPGPAPVAAAALDTPGALHDFLQRNHDHVVLTDDWVPGARRTTEDPMVRTVMNND